MTRYEDITLADLVARSETSVRLANRMPTHWAANMKVSRFLQQGDDVASTTEPLRGLGRKTGNELLRLARAHAEIVDTPEEPFPVKLSAKAARSVQVLELIEAEGSAWLKEMAAEKPRLFGVAVAEACLDIDGFVTAAQKRTGQNGIAPELRALLEWHAPTGEASPIDILAELRAAGVEPLTDPPSIDVLHDPRTVAVIESALRKAIDEYDGCTAHGISIESSKSSSAATASTGSLLPRSRRWPTTAVWAGNESVNSRTWAWRRSADRRPTRACADWRTWPPPQSSRISAWTSLSSARCRSGAYASFRPRWVSSSRSRIDRRASGRSVDCRMSFTISYRCRGTQLTSRGDRWSNPTRCRIWSIWAHEVKSDIVSDLTPLSRPPPVPRYAPAERSPRRRNPRPGSRRSNRACAGS